MAKAKGKKQFPPKKAAPAMPGKMPMMPMPMANGGKAKKGKGC